MAQVIECDVLVVGGGGAAARAAVEAQQAGARVVLAVKGRFGAIGTRGSGATASGLSEFGGLRAIGIPGGPPELEPDAAFEDAVQAGLGMADRKLVSTLVAETWEAIVDLKNWGGVFGGLGIRSHGVPIMNALESVIRKTRLPRQAETMVTSLLIQDGTCVGAMGIGENGGVYVFKAGATILGTGGDGRLFLLNLLPSCVTGDGHAMGYEAGAELRNMEFNQTFLGTVHPTINLLSDEWIWQHYPRITNAKGEEFIQNYLPSGVTVRECMDQRFFHTPFSTRDPLSRYVDIAIMKEVLAGRGSAHLGVYLDMTAPGISIPPHVQDFYLYRGIDFAREPGEIGNFFHCSDGGLVINENAETTIPGLYAAGETAAGPHGADRMGGNMLAASQVFGRRAGRHAAARVKQTGIPRVDENLIAEKERQIRQLEASSGDQKPAEVTKVLQRLAWENMLLTRSQENLSKVLGEVNRMRTEMMPRLSVSSPRELVEAFELENLLRVAEMIARAARLREESRGGHYREDFPHRDDKKWLKSISIKNIAGEMQTSTVTVDPDWKDRPGDMGPGKWG